MASHILSRIASPEAGRKLSLMAIAAGLTLLVPLPAQSQSVVINGEVYGGSRSSGYRNPPVYNSPNDLGSSRYDRYSPYHQRGYYRGYYQTPIVRVQVRNVRSGSRGDDRPILVNPTIINSEIRDSTLINPTIIDSGISSQSSTRTRRFSNWRY